MSKKKNASNETAISNEAGNVPEQEIKSETKIAKPTTIRKPVVTSLRFVLTDPELVAKADFAGKRSRALGVLENEFDAVKAEFKGRIEKMRGEIGFALRCIDERAEFREVMATDVYDYVKAEVRTEFEGKVFFTRDMHASERQLELEVKTETKNDTSKKDAKTNMSAEQAEAANTSETTA